MEWEIILTDQVEDFLDQLWVTVRESHRLVNQAILVLERNGPTEGRPLVDSITASSLSNMKELRPPSGGRTEVRILFVFDPWRSAVLLVAGDKSGQWKRWYRAAIPEAEQRYAVYLKERQGGELMGTRRWRDTEHLDRAIATAGGPEKFEGAVERMLDEARGWRLVELRKRREMTQEQVAVKMGVSVARVSQIESGAISTQEVLARYIAALGGTLKLIADFGDEQLKVA